MPIPASLVNLRSLWIREGLLLLFGFGLSMKSLTQKRNCSLWNLPLPGVSNQIATMFGWLSASCLSWSYNPLITPDACALCLRSGARAGLISFNCSQCVLTPPVCAVYLWFVTTPVIHSSLQQIQSSNSAQNRSRRRGIRAQKQNKVSGLFSKLIKRQQKQPVLCQHQQQLTLFTEHFQESSQATQNKLNELSFKY